MRVLTIGTFDLFHRGHEELLRRASLFCGGRVWVGVNSDDFVRKYKGRPAAQSEEERVLRVSESPYVSREPIVNDGPGADLIRLVKPDLLVIGSDWHDCYLPQIDITAQELFDKLGCGIVYLPRTPNVSTTQLRG